jgi:hypothetical protein
MVTLSSGPIGIDGLCDLQFVQSRSESPESTGHNLELDLDKDSQPQWRLSRSLDLIFTNFLDFRFDPWCGGPVTADP